MRTHGGCLHTLALLFVLGAALALPAQPKPARDTSVAAALAESTEPSDKDLAALLLAESLARSAVRTLRDEADKTYRAWAQSAALLKEKVIPPGFKRPTPEEVEGLLERFRAKHEGSRKAYLEHVDRYRALLAKHPHHWRAHHKFAWFLSDFGDYLAAAEHWRQTVALKPDFAFGYNNLATLYNHLGRDMESIDLYLKAIALRADEPEFHYNLANVLSMHRFAVAAKFTWAMPKVFHQSIEHYRAARSLQPANREYAEAVATHYVMAKHFEVKDWADEALKDWQFCLDAAEAPSDRARALTSMARIYMRQKGLPEKARVMLLDAAKLADSPTVHVLLKEADRRIKGD